MNTKIDGHPIWQSNIFQNALLNSVLKLSPLHQIRNPVMFTVYIGALLTTLLFINAFLIKADANTFFILWVAILLWVTIIFANFAEAMAEGRGKNQANALRKSRKEIQAKKLTKPERGSKISLVASGRLRAGDIVLVEAGDFIPGDGEVIEGIASVNESAITGESAPVIRESGGDRNTVTGGTQILSDWLIVRILANPGEAFLDRMIDMVESATRQKTLTN